MYNTMAYMDGRAVNPFSFGALALDEAFVDREAELAGLLSDLRSGQDVVLLAPRRYGKSSLALRAVQVAAGEGTLVAYCDLMRTPTKQRFAAALAKSILDDLATPAGQLVERAASLVRGLRVRPTIEIDPDGGGVSFSFEAARAPADIDETIERLLELPGRIAAERNRRVALVLDEFQEVVKLDDRLPNLMRAVFQTQPEVGHVYLGSKRHVLESIFSDRNEPFWRSAKRVELGRIPAAPFASYLHDRFRATERDADDEAVARILEIADGHPYATQELAYFTWSRVPHGFATHASDVDAALAEVLRAEHNNLARIWDGATRNERVVLLALRAGPASLYAEETRNRFGLPAATYVQRATTSLAREDVVEKGPDGRYRIAEPFLPEWIEREQRGPLEPAHAGREA
jgi:AAA+ ATPase superfamily predicted ATPase